MLLQEEESVLNDLLSLLTTLLYFLDNTSLSIVLFVVSV